MKPAELMLLLIAFIRTRWGFRFRDRASLERWQNKQLARFIGGRLRNAAFYSACTARNITTLPIVDKAITLAQFSAFNTLGVSLEDATNAALVAERSLDKAAAVETGWTAGLSSGTQGPRGVFLASARERATWAGILVARTLDRDLLKDILLRRAPLRVAFFLRANSALYTTLKSRRIDFRFFDLQRGAFAHVDALTQFEPDVLVAPASVLAWLAGESLAGRAAISPRKIISVAEVLEPDDEHRIRLAFHQPVHQLYQCTEGFLAYTCAEGALHLNEEFVHIEPEWIDESHTRFRPVITDFTRRTQMFVRYRLDDILRVRAEPCACGRFTRALAAIDGRLDDVLWFPTTDHTRLLPLFPDVLRHTFARNANDVADYRIEQQGDTLHLAVTGNDAVFDAIKLAVDKLAISQGMEPLPWLRVEMQEPRPAAKRRRIVCVARPLAFSVRIPDDA
ncbi:F390 synthetase-related protein [Caballeronia sp.]|uniref:F390 synthetase-related protein n=1 Tax=Caballeronia sp. TaxID=1931223 RepID=UPI003C5442A7